MIATEMEIFRRVMRSFFTLSDVSCQWSVVSCQFFLVRSRKRFKWAVNRPPLVSNLQSPIPSPQPLVPSPYPLPHPQAPRHRHDPAEDADLHRRRMVSDIDRRIAGALDVDHAK